MESTQLLKEVFLFQDLTPFELIQFNKILESRKVTKGEVVIKEGEEANEMYIVKDGEFTVSKLGSSGEVDVLAHLGRGSHFGEIALIDRSKRSASVTADTDGDLLVLTSGPFGQVLDSDQKVKIKIYEAFLSTLCGRLRLANENLITAHELVADD